MTDSRTIAQSVRQSHKKYADSTILTQTVGIIISDRFLRNKKT